MSYESVLLVGNCRFLVAVAGIEMEWKMISKIAAEILKINRPFLAASKIVAIDAPGGAGKSTLAMDLSRELDNCPIVHTDELATWDVPLLWYPRMIEQVLEPLKLNRTARYQKYDWNLKRLGEWLEVPAARVVILEGVSSARKAFRPYLSFSEMARAHANIGSFGVSRKTRTLHPIRCTRLDVAYAFGILLMSM